MNLLTSVSLTVPFFLVSQWTVTEVNTGCLRLDKKNIVVSFPLATQLSSPSCHWLRKWTAAEKFVHRSFIAPTDPLCGSESSVKWEQEGVRELHWVSLRSSRVQLKRDGTRRRREGKWMGNWRMEWVTSTLHTTSEHGVSSITTAYAHTSAASSRLNWRPLRFKWTCRFRRKTKSGFCACAITFQTQSTADVPYLETWGV